MKKSKINSIKTSSTLFFILLSMMVGAQNFSGLQGKELTRIDDTAFALLQLGAKKLDGQIDKVTVTYSGEKTLKLEVHHSGIASAWLSYKIIDSEKRPLTQIKNIKYAEIEGRKPLNIEITLKNNLPEGTEIQSSYLQIDVKKEKKNFLPTTFLYSLEKLWKTEISAENLVIPIKLEPRGSAADLTIVNKLVVPTKNQHFKVTKSYMQIKPPNQSSYKPLSHYWNNSRTDNFSTATVKGKNNALAAKYRYVRIDGYVTNTAHNAEGQAVPLWLYYSNTRKDNFTTATPQGIKAAESGGYKKSGIEGYVLKTVKPEYKHLYKPLWLYYHDSRKDNFSIATPEGIRVAEAGGYRKVRIEGYVRKTNTTAERRNEVVFAKRGKDLNPKSTNTEVLGPDYDNQISLWDYYKADGATFEFPHEITNVNMTIYPDKNPASGRFYYMPNAYHLRWNADEGYQFRMLYGTGDDESSGNIRMSGTLTPGLGNNETDLMKSLLESYLKDNSNFSNTYELKIMPIKTTPIITLSAGLEGQYNIPSEKINIGKQSEINAPIDVSWVTDNRTKEFMEVVLSEGSGIFGSMILEPEGEDFPSQMIDIRITLADVRTLGQLSLQPNTWRTKQWLNKTPYPLKLKFIHALVIGKVDNKSVPIIYSWSLGNTEVPPNAKVNFDATKMPKWLEENGKSERIWIDYGIVDCASCVNKVMAELTGGTSGSKVKNITFESLKVFENLDAAFLNIKIRSKQADPKGNTMVELPSIRIEKDLSTYSSGPLYISEGKSAEYEYYFTLISSNGIAYHSDDWKSSKEQEMFIGLHNLKDLKDENGTALVLE